MKRKWVIVLALLLCSPVTTLRANSQKNTNTNDEANFDSHEQYLNSPDYFGEEHQKRLKIKEAELKAYKAQHNSLARDAVRLKLPGYLQENSYFCGPASVQNVIKYKTGKKFHKAL